MHREYNPWAGVNEQRTPDHSASFEVLGERDSHDNVLLQALIGENGQFELQGPPHRERDNHDNGYLEVQFGENG